MSLAIADPPTSLTVRPWPDSVLDRVGIDPRSPYVERFWLPLLGPSSVLLLRRLATELEANPAEVELPVDDTAKSLGLGMRGGKTSPFLRTVHRCCQFHLTHLDEANGVLLARRKMPPLTRPQVNRLPERLQESHAAWQDEALRADADAERLRHRARHLALSLFELGEDVESTERQLGRWRFHPAIARDAVAWALQRHRAASSMP
jgi:hypothetical protein